MMFMMTQSPTFQTLGQDLYSWDKGEPCQWGGTQRKSLFPLLPAPSQCLTVASLEHFPFEKRKICIHLYSHVFISVKSQGVINKLG